MSKLFVAILLLAIIGFYGTYFRFFPFLNDAISSVVHVHAFFMVIWILLLIAQPLLVSSGKLYWHRLIGRYSWILVTCIAVSSFAIIYESYVVDVREAVPLLTNIALRMVSIITIFSFVVFYLLAIKYKKSTSIHARYMLGTGLTVIPASATRLFYFLNVNNIISELMALVLINVSVILLIQIDNRSGVSFKTNPLKVILGFQLALTGYYGLLLLSTAL